MHENNIHTRFYYSLKKKQKKEHTMNLQFWNLCDIEKKI